MVSRSAKNRPIWSHWLEATHATRVSIVSKPLRKWGRFVARYGGLVVASSLTLEVDDSSSNPDDR